MHFIVVGSLYYGYSESIVRVLEEEGHTVDFYAERPFYTNCSYLTRRLYKWGFRSFQKKWERDWQSACIAFMREHMRADSVLLCLTGGMISDELLDIWQGHSTVLMMWDSVRRYDMDFQRRMRRYQHVFAFEYTDIAYAAQTFHIEMTYLPLGYDPLVYYPKEVERDIDVSFVGTPMPQRVEVLERVAAYMSNTGGRMYVGGRWYDDRYPWKVRSYRRKHPHLFPVLTNQELSPEEVAQIYRRSKIVLNINNDVHHSVSPRTFEILATQTFQLMNSGQQSNGTLDFDRDLVQYDDVDDLIRKIDFYLQHDEMRAQIAAHGAESVRRFSLDELTKRMVGKLCSLDVSYR